MAFLFTMIVSSLAGAVGWWIGNFFGLAMAISLSMVASVVGLFYGQKWNREYFE